METNYQSKRLKDLLSFDDDVTIASNNVVMATNDVEMARNGAVMADSNKTEPRNVNGKLT